MKRLNRGFANLTIILAMIVGAGVLTSGAFLWGKHKGKQEQKAETISKALESVTNLLNKTAEVGQDMAEIARDTAQRQAESATTTRTIVDRGVRYVQVRPKLRDLVVDPYALELRKCAVDQAWRAAGRELPSERAGAVCPPELPDQ